jgi:large subunit ribosomal protein L22
MNTASRHRAIQAVIEDHIKTTELRHTPISRVKVEKIKETNGVKVEIYSSRPELIKAEANDIQQSIQDQGDGRDVNVKVIGEARAVAKFIRMSPRKCRLVIDAIKGKRVSDAIDILRFVPNYAAEPILKLLRSAAANALIGWGADPTELRVHNYIADGGPILKRIRARAQGRAYRILKRTTHLTVVLLETEAPKLKRRIQNTKKAAKAVAPVAEEVTVAPASEEVVETPTAVVAETTTTNAPESEGGAEQA